MSGKKLAIPTVILIIFCMGLVISFWMFDLVINITPSMPVGIWRVFNSENGKKDLKGKVILICPNRSMALDWALDQEILASGRCKSGSIPLLKGVVAVDGDRVEIFGDEVFINGEFSVKRHLDMPDQLIGEWNSYLILKDQVWVVGTQRDESFDSRYLGALSLDGILGVARPVWVWGS